MIYYQQVTKPTVRIFTYPAAVINMPNKIRADRIADGSHNSLLPSRLCGVFPGYAYTFEKHCRKHYVERHRYGEIGRAHV